MHEPCPLDGEAGVVGWPGLLYSWGRKGGSRAWTSRSDNAPGTLVDPMPYAAGVESSGREGADFSAYSIGTRLECLSPPLACVVNVLKVKEGRGYTRQGITIPTGSPSCRPRPEKPYENPSVMASLSLFRMWATHNGLPRSLGLFHPTSKTLLDSSPPQFLLLIIPLWLHRPLCCSHFKACPCSSLCLIPHTYVEVNSTDLCL